MGRVGRFVRPALEQAVRLVRDSSDWNPPLKSAAGGVACILEQARLCEDNVKAAAGLLNRIGEIANELQRHSLEDVVVGPHLRRLESLLVGISSRLKPLRKRSLFAAYARAQRDTLLIQGCTSDIDSLIRDIQLALSLTARRDMQEVLTAVLEGASHSPPTLAPTVTCPAPSLEPATPIAASDSTPAPFHSSSLASEGTRPVAEQLMLIDVRGYRFVLKRSHETGRLQIEADAIVLFSWEVSKGALTVRK